MLGSSDLKLIESMIKREQRVIDTYSRYILQIKDPQTQIDLQKLMSNHINQKKTLLSLMEEQ